MSAQPDVEHATHSTAPPAPVKQDAFAALGQPEENLPDGLHHHGSFRTYMQHKNLKLREQFEARQAHGQATELFKGISIHVNGHTVPGHQELKQLMALHGGRFETYFYPDRVTHIICNNLPDTKLKHLAHARKPVPIVRADWITASLRAGQLLPVRDFQLETLRDMPNQRKLTDFQKHNADRLAPAEIFPVLEQLPQVHTDQAATGSGQQPVTEQPLPGAPDSDTFLQPNKRVRFAVDDQPLARTEGASRQQQQQQQWQQAHEQEQEKQQHVHQQGHHVHAELLPSSTLSPAAAQQPHKQSVDVQHGGHLPPDRQGEQQAATRQPAASASALDTSMDLPAAAKLRNAQQTAAALRAACDVLKGKPRTSHDDPEFMATFFKSSRLHFIGTWRTRIEALMASLDGGAPMPRQPVRKTGIARAFAGAVGGASSPSSDAASAPTERAIIHLDMDCFFASASTVGRPELKGLPLAVCHSNNDKGSAEVSAANYDARAFGIRAGMFMSDAKRRCPDLVVVPYEFDRYQEISEKVYRILMGYSGCVQPLSVDEAYVDVTGLGDPEAIAASMRADIERITQCTASVGIGPNVLVARLATKTAKPNGQRRILAAQARSFLADLPIDQLPGVGYSLKQRLASELSITTVRQVWATSKENLMRKLGKATGANLWNFALGNDDRPVEPPKARKSVGAEVNWGIRFANDDEAQRFLLDIATEVAERMRPTNSRGKALTLKIKRKQAGAPEPPKFLGHGACDNISRSVTLGRYVDSAQDIYRECAVLLTALQIPCEEIRGIGITVAKLSTDPASATAKPSLTAPAKMPHTTQSAYDATKHSWWMDDTSLPAAKEPQQQQQPQQQPQQPQEQQHQQGSEQGQTVEAHEQIRPEQPQSAFLQEEPADQVEHASGDCQAVQAQSPAMPAPLAASPAMTQSPATAAAARRRAHPPLQPSPIAVALQRSAGHGGGGRNSSVSKGTNAAGAAAGTPIAALPPASQLDPEVLDALPLPMRRELERAYGLRLCSSPAAAKRTRAQPAPSFKHEAAGGPSVTHAAGAAPHYHSPTPKRRRTTNTHSANSSPAGMAAASSPGGLGLGRSSPAPRPPAVRPLTLSQIDPQVLRALPKELQQEVLAALPEKEAAATRRAARQAAQDARAAKQASTAASTGLGRLEPGTSNCQAPGLLAFREEPWPAVRSALATAVAALSAAAASTTADGVSSCTTAAEGAVPDESGAQRPVQRKLGVLCEYLAQWLVANDHDLQVVQQCLKQIARLRRQHASFGAHADTVMGVVQQHVRTKFGFDLTV